MSIIRIVLGVIVGGCIVAGLLAAAIRFRTTAMFVMFGSAGGAILAVAYHGLRTGVVGAKRSRYERSANPFAYWFYISFYALIGMVIFGYAVCCLL
jgi:hypothetical protein